MQALKRKKKKLKSQQMNISNTYCKNDKHQFHLQSAQFIS